MRHPIVQKSFFFWFVYLVLLISCSQSSVENTVTVHTIEIKAMKFVPSTLVINKGDSVVWFNTDIVDHDVAEESGDMWRSSKLTFGKRWGMVVNQDYNYYCDLHKVMKGELRILNE